MKFKRTLSKTILLLFVIAGIISLRFAYFSLGPILANKIKNTARNNNIILELETPQYKPILTLKSDTLRAQIPADRLFIPLILKDINATIPIYKFFVNKLELNIKGQGYGGKIDAIINTGLLTNTTNLSTQIENFNLSEYPITAGFQLTGNVAINSSATFSSNNINLKTLESGTALINIKDGSCPEGFKIKSKNPILNSIPLPKISNLNLKAEFNYLNSYFTLSTLNIDCSLAKITGKGGIVVQKENSSFSSGRLRINISLTTEGHKVLGPYLALAAPNNTNNLSDRWSLNIQFEPQKPPQVELTPLLYSF